MVDTPTDTLTLADIITLLGHKQWSSLMQKFPGHPGVLNHHINPKFVPTLVDSFEPGDVWVGVNEITTPPTDNRRATEQTVGRWCAVWADLDYGPTKTGDNTTMNAIIDDITLAYGTEPTYITLSGHGIQPVWILDHTDPNTVLDTDEKRATAVALMKRHGRLVQTTAHKHGVKADSVFDLPRVLRAPGTLNHKNPNELVETSAIRAAGVPLTVAELEQSLTQAGIVDQPEPAHTPITPRTRTSEQGDECWYVREMIDGWPGDPTPARHPWHLGQAIRVEVAHLAGCLTPRGYQNARNELDRIFTQKCGDSRAPGELQAEIRRAWTTAARDAPSKDPGRELGRGTMHEHNPPRDPDDLAELYAIIGRPTPPADVASGAKIQHQTPEKHGENMPENIPTTPLPAVTETPNRSTLDRDGTLRLTDYTPDHELETIEAGFWTSRPELTQIFRTALIEKTAPWAVLGQIIARTLAAIPPDAELPPSGNSPYSRQSRNGGALNLHIAIVGSSGAGKGESATVAKLIAPRDGDQYETRGIGSGEGLAAMYCAPDPNDGKRNIMVRTNILVDIPEIDSLSALVSRSGSTLETVLREAYSGERLGREYRGTNKMPVNAHTYRFISIIGVQYARAGTLLNTASSDGGTAQRVIWMPTKDYRARPAQAALHAYYGSGGTDLPTIKPTRRILGSEWPHASRGEFITMPAVAADAIADHRLAAMERSETAPADPEAHSLFTRCKVAVALAAMAGRTGVTDHDWELSGVVMAVSTLTRERTAAALKATTRTAAEERGELRGIEWEQAKSVEQTVRADKLRAARKTILETLREGGPSKRQPLRDALGRNKQYLNEAINTLTADELITTTETSTAGQGGRPTVVYALAEASA